MNTSSKSTIRDLRSVSSIGDQAIVIVGHAVERASGLPLANVPLKLVISFSGFERTSTVVTDAGGLFSYSPIFPRAMTSTG